MSNSIIDYIFDLDFKDPNNTGLLEDIFGFAKNTLGNPDLQGLLSLGGGVLANYLGGGSKGNPVGYQGGIPEYTVDRQQLDYNDPERRPGSAGRRYFTDTTFTEVPKAPAPTTTPPTNMYGLTEEQLQALYEQYLADSEAPAETPAEEQATTQPYDAAQAGDLWNQLLGAYNSGDNVAARDFYDQYYALTGTKTAPEGYDALPTIDEVEAQQEPPPAPQDEPPQTEPPPRMAAGGLAGLAKGKYLNGATDGMADKVPARINGTQEARLSDGEFVVPADVVSHLGNGNSDAGAKELYDMMDRIRHARTGRKSQGKEINPRKYMPK